MAKMTELRWHARAGQGAVTAAKIYAEAALVGGKYVQAFPEYGPERMGAPLRAFDRISDEPISIHCQVENPNVVVVVDPTLLESVDVTEGITQNGILLVNTDMEPEELRKTLIKADGTSLYTLDATKIATEEMGRNIPNMPLLGALAKITADVEMEPLIEKITETLGKKFTQKVADANVAAIKRGYDEVKGL